MKIKFSTAILNLKKIGNKFTVFLKPLKFISLVDRILILTALTGVLFFMFVFLRKSNYIVATIKVGEDSSQFDDWVNYAGPRPWLAQLLHEGVSQKDGLGRNVAEVISVSSYDMRPNREAVYVKTKLKVTYNSASNQYIYNGIPLTVGAIVRMNFDTVSFEGLVTNIDGVSDIREKVKLQVGVKLKDENSTYIGTSGVSPAVAKEIENINEVKDGEGNVIMKVIQKDIEDADIVTTNSSGKSIAQKNPLRKDVALTLEVEAIKIGNRYYLFDDMPILVGEKIPLNTEKISVFPEVTKITVGE